MKKLNGHRVGVDSGCENVVSDFTDDGEMWVGQGQRARSLVVKFSEPFLRPPTVQLGVAMSDVSNDANARLEIAAEDITNTEFNIVFQTWGDTKIARLRANWLAIGEVETDEVWDV